MNNTKNGKIVNLKQIIEKSKDWTPHQRFGQFIYNAICFGEDMDADEFQQTLFYIDNDKLIETLEAWLTYQKKEQNAKTKNTNLRH